MSAPHPLLDQSYLMGLKENLFQGLKGDEYLFLSYAAEESQFLRLNEKIRQIGLIQDADLTLTYGMGNKEGGSPRELRQSVHSLTLCGDRSVDQERLKAALAHLRSETPTLPLDPFAEVPKALPSSSLEKRGALLSPEEAAEILLTPLSSGTGAGEVVGIYASGPSIRAMAHSFGTTHWFRTDTFSFDYSIYPKRSAGGDLPHRAIKGLYAGTHFDQKAYLASIERSQAKVGALAQKARVLPKGEYRAYLEPSAFADIVHMLSWGAIGEASLRQGESPLRALRSGEASLSKRFSLNEDFTLGLGPRFNEEGELAPEYLPLIGEGKLAHTLVSARSAKEYGMQSNGASLGEALRSASVAPGELRENEALSLLGTGLLISNLHYLNWSDQPGGRITGMTRYACFWVENERLMAPIENLRFDDSLFHLLGDSLEGLGSAAHLVPDVGSYGMRALGGVKVPSALLSKMRFTL